ncbi:MAG: hypothetical protein AUI21_03540 [Nitrospirae bacterium 13_1_40CM_2_62_10]|nr:MAG: hypothetical protein AUI21_03540 [Nitrospirae bacterium 13_1_40CM_2_62_10]
MDMRALVEAELRRRKAPRLALDLWGEIILNFVREGPEGVTTVVQSKIRAVKRRAKKEEAEIKKVAKKPKKKPKARLKRSRMVTN